MKQTFCMLLWEHATTLRKTLIPNAAIKLFLFSLQGSHMDQFVKNTLSHMKSLGYNQKLNQSFKN